LTGGWSPRIVPLNNIPLSGADYEDVRLEQG